MSPMCCGMPAIKVVVSPRLEFWSCGECKKEVLDIPAPDTEVSFEWEQLNLWSTDETNS